MSKIIYLITNLINGKQYVGQTNNFNRRMNEHRNSNNKGVDAAIKKYGANNFSFEILCDYGNNISAEALNEAEIWWIDYYDSLVPKGYNINRGGANHKRTEKEKRKISKSLKKYFKNNEHHNAVKIICIETGAIYNSMTECAKANNISEGVLSIHVNDPKRRHSVKGNHYARLNSDIPYTEYSKQHFTKKIICTDNGLIFNSQKEAAEYIGCSAAQLSEYLNYGKSNPKIKLHFERMV